MISKIVSKEQLSLGAVFIIGCALSFLQGINQSDESWFFQVVCRMNQGEVLYRDIFFGATPLSPYLAKWIVSIAGEELWVLKCLMVLCFTATVWITRKIGRALGIRRGLVLFVPLAMLALSERNMCFSSSLYNPLANLFFLGSFILVLKGLPGWAGLAAGLCFCAKHTQGVWAIGAVLLGALYQKQRMGRPFLAFALVVVACIGWLHVTDGLDRFLDYGVINKTAYLRHGGVLYFQGVNFKSYLAPLFLLPVAAYLSLVAAYRRGMRYEAMLLAIFLTAGYCNVYPRGEGAHMTLTLPLGLIALLLRCEKMRGDAVLQIGKTACAALGLLLTALLAQPFAKRPLVFCHWPHFQGMIIQRDEKEEIERSLSLIQGERGGEPVVFFHINAAFYYLVLGLKNPTPYDLPARTSMGRHGQKEVASLWANGEIRLFVRDKEIKLQNKEETLSWIERWLAGTGSILEEKG